MHFSIPDTEEFSTENGSSYIGYNIHINGIFHCTVRYRQLHNLHEQLKKEYGSINLPVFPPKKFLPLSSSQLEERRAMLEKYIQSIGQDQQLVNSELFNGFLLSAQQETTQENCEEVDFEVHLMNGHAIVLNILSIERSDQVLEKACNKINLPSEYVYYFSLFLIKQEECGEFTIVRKLQDFESPYISQKSIPGAHRVVLRKSYWDPEYDLELMSDAVALNLLYLQTVADVEHGWILCNKDTHKQLVSLQARGSKRELCVCDYPDPNTVVLVSAGNRELNLRIQMPNSGDTREGSFKVTRMRCWRITTLHNNGSNKMGPQLELSFEYLMSKDKLQWITITSDQAILMSLCLQAMVDELLLKKTGGKRKTPIERARKESWLYMKRDGSSHQICLSQCSSSDSISSAASISNGDIKLTEKLEPSTSIRRLSEKFCGMLVRPSTSKHKLSDPHSYVENDAFEEIGDDDL